MKCSLIRMAGPSEFAIAAVLLFDNGFMALTALAAGGGGRESAWRCVGYVEPLEADAR